MQVMICLNYYIKVRKLYLKKMHREMHKQRVRIGAEEKVKLRKRERERVNKIE